MCVFQVTWNFKIGTVGSKFFHFVKSFYMGKMGKRDGRPGKSLGNPLNMFKTLGSGQKIKHGRVTWNTQFFILGLNTFDQISAPAPISISAQLKTFDLKSVPAPISTQLKTFDLISVPAPISVQLKTFDLISVPAPVSAQLKTFDLISVPAPISVQLKTFDLISVPAPVSAHWTLYRRVTHYNYELLIPFQSHSCIQFM